MINLYYMDNKGGFLRMENQETDKKMMSIVAEDGSIEEVEVILAFEFKDNKNEVDGGNMTTEKIDKNFMKGNKTLH